MIELIVTCFLVVTFVPPTNWTVIEVFAPFPFGMISNRNYCNGPCPEPIPYIKLARTMKIGETIEPPGGCQLQAKETEKKP